MQDKDKGLIRHKFIKGSVPTGAIISALGSWSIRFWLTAIIVVASFLVLPLTLSVNAAPEPDTPLECLSCHTRVLKDHDKLGSGSEACWVCHDSTKIGMLRLADGTQLPLADSSVICGQCHRGRYDAWQGGLHGAYTVEEAEPGIPGTEKMKCINCHNPHQPQIALSDITRTPPALAVSGEEAPLECLSCHVRVLKGHDKLGEGSEACWSCHDNRTMGVLHLASGETRFPLADFSRLCAQCHQKRYEAWAEGTHGAPAWKEGDVEVHGTQRVGCIGCHDPHQPQIALLNITKPHPAPAPPPPPPSVEPLIMLGISLLLVIGIGVVVATRGEGP